MLLWVMCVTVDVWIGLAAANVNIQKLGFNLIKCVMVYGRMGVHSH